MYQEQIHEDLVAMIHSIRFWPVLILITGVESFGDAFTREKRRCARYWRSIGLEIRRDDFQSRAGRRREAT